MLPLIALAVGIVIAVLMPYDISSEASPYIAIAIIAALDSVFGGITANMQKNFKINTFLSGFFLNALLAAGLTILGKRLGVDLSLAAIVVFGTRMFQNFALMRHLVIKKFEKKKLLAIEATSDFNTIDVSTEEENVKDSKISVDVDSE